jgi:hypothetical protein
MFEDSGFIFKLKKYVTQEVVKHEICFFEFLKNKEKKKVSVSEKKVLADIDTLTWFWSYSRYSHKLLNHNFLLFFPAFYVDCDAPAYCFVPCGHMASPKTVKYWAEVPIPCGTSGFQSACPFCAVPLTGTPGYVKLIFQAMSD